MKQKRPSKFTREGSQTISSPMLNINHLSLKRPRRRQSFESRVSFKCWKDIHFANSGCKVSVFCTFLYNIGSDKFPWGATVIALKYYSFKSLVWIGSIIRFCYQDISTSLLTVPPNLKRLPMQSFMNSEKKSCLSWAIGAP